MEAYLPLAIQVNVRDGGEVAVIVAVAPQFSSKLAVGVIDVLKAQVRHVNDNN